jgi:hypothetical protein
LNADQVVVVAKPQSELPKQYRDVTWSPGNQEVAFAAVIVMLIAAVLAVVQSVRLRALRQQIAAMRADYARRESAAPAARS